MEQRPSGQIQSSHRLHDRCAVPSLGEGESASFWASSALVPSEPWLWIHSNPGRRVPMHERGWQREETKKGEGTSFNYL